MNADSRFSTQEEFIIHLMNEGCIKSALSFSKFINSPVKITGNQSILIRSMDKFSYVHHDPGILHVFRTQLLGAVAGTSFLVFTENERNALLSGIEKWNLKNASDEFKDSMLSEIANIISASTIAELSNALQQEIYGDVPEIFKVDSRELQIMITNDLVDKKRSSIIIPASVIMLSNIFTIGSNFQVHPQFLWKLDVRILERIPTNEVSI
jgi:chemotaxis protein CheY-P-specific phosphatase CheC